MKVLTATLAAILLTTVAVFTLAAPTPACAYFSWCDDCVPGNPWFPACREVCQCNSEGDCNSGPY